VILDKVAKNWWALALRGVAAIIFGFLALIWPALTILTLVLLFGAYALVDGIFALTAGIASHKKNEFWWAMALAGVSGIILGLLTLLWPGATALVLLFLIAAWALVTGIFHIIAAIHLRRVIKGEWMVILGGIGSVIFGLILAIFPGAGALGLVWAIGIFSLCFGIWQIIFAFRLRGLATKSKN
jgi:uncharacterized membrane protein HdeD (DUF308 family)